jgi:hypothetical protein
VNTAYIIGATTITHVWLALGGPEPKRGRAPAFYRNGDNPQTVSLNDAKQCWYDHRDGKGGGVLDLIQRVLGCDRARAMRWLSSFTGIPLEDRPFTTAERRQYARQRAKADRLARDVADFEHGLELFLTRRLAHIALVATWLLSHDIDPGDADVFGTPASDLAALRSLNPDLLVQTYCQLPESVRCRFREEGRNDRELTEWVTNAIVRMLAKVDSSKAVA